MLVYYLNAGTKFVEEQGSRRRNLGTDDDPTGHVTLTRHTGSGAISRADVALVLAALLDAPHTAGATLELVAGPTPIADAVNAARA